MSANSHLLIACLQISLWLYRAFVIGDSALFSTTLLVMFLVYHCLNVLLDGAGRLRRLSRCWAHCWVGLMLLCLVVPGVFGMKGWPPELMLRSLAFAAPCLLLYALPVIPDESFRVTEQSSNGF